MNLNFCGQTPSFTRTFWMEGPSISSGASSSSDSDEYAYLPNGSVVQCKKYENASMILIQDELQLVSAIKNELKELEGQEVEFDYKITLDFSKLFCLISNNISNIFRGSSLHSTRTICRKLKKTTEILKHRNVDLIKNLCDSIFEIKPVKEVLLTKLFFDKVELNRATNPFANFPKEINQLIFTLFSKSCFFLKLQSKQTSSFTKTFWMGLSEEVHWLQNVGFNCPQKIKTIDNELQLECIIQEEISSLAYSSRFHPFPDASKLKCLICLNIDNLFRNVSTHSKSRIYEGSRVLTQDPNSLNYYQFNRLFDVIFEIQPVKDLLVKNLLIDAKWNISRNPFKLLPRGLKQIIFNFFEKL